MKIRIETKDDDGFRSLMETDVDFNNNDSVKRLFIKMLTFFEKAGWVLPDEVKEGIYEEMKK